MYIRNTRAAKPTTDDSNISASKVNNMVHATSPKKTITLVDIFNS